MFSPSQYDVVFPPIPPAKPPNHLPSLAFSRNGCRLFHLQDRLFNRPNTELRLKVMTSLNRMSALECTVADILVRVIADSLTETTYLASLCDLEYRIEACKSDGYFGFRFYGFNDKLFTLSSFVLGKFLAFRDSPSLELPEFVEESRFSSLLESQKRSYENLFMNASSFSSELRVRSLMHTKSR